LYEELNNSMTTNHSSNIDEIYTKKQEIQTQVISVQELLGLKDTIITFPNRMAISNVDVNFKVKIDVYAMETNPKEKHKNLHQS
jgi:hypothetical protein